MAVETPSASPSLGRSIPGQGPALNQAPRVQDDRGDVPAAGTLDTSLHAIGDPGSFELGDRTENVTLQPACRRSRVYPLAEADEADIDRGEFTSVRIMAKVAPEAAPVNTGPRKSARYFLRQSISVRNWTILLHGLLRDQQDGR